MEVLMNFINVGLVVAFVAIVQSIKKVIDDNRVKKGLNVLSPNIWKIVVLVGGIPMAIISIGIDGLSVFNNLKLFEIIAQIIFRIFLYGASASFAYQNYKLVREKLKGNNNG